MLTSAVALYALFCAPPPLSQTDRIADMKLRMAPLRTSDPTVAGDDYADLEPIGRAIGGRRIVMMGDQTHMDGTTYDMRTRILKYLHEKKGFDVVAMEMCLPNAYRYDQKLSDGPPEGIGRLDSYGTVLRNEHEMFSYISRTKKTSRPMRFFGHDTIFYMYTGLTAHLKATLSKAAPSVAEMPEWERIENVQDEKGTDGKKPGEEQIQQMVADVATIDAALAKAIPDERRLSEETRVALRTLRSLPKGFKSYVAMLNGAGTMQDPIRDGAMGEILLWIVNELFPNKKIVVLSAAFHQIKTGRQGAPEHTWNFATMGTHLRSKMDKDVYTIGFDAYDGRVGPIFEYRDGKLAGKKYFPIHPSPEGSVAWAARATGFRQGFLDLLTLPKGHWLRGRCVSRVLGHDPYEAVWPEVLDGIVYLDEMKPADEAKGARPSGA